MRPTGCLPSEVLANTRLRVCVAGRSSGLRTFQLLADLLLAAASQSGWISALLRFSRFAYRCGAAPDSHRIPSYAPISAPATKAAYDVVHDGVNTKYCG